MTRSRESGPSASPTPLDGRVIDIRTREPYSDREFRVLQTRVLRMASVGKLIGEERRAPFSVEEGDGQAIEYKGEKDSRRCSLVSLPVQGESEDDHGRGIDYVFYKNGRIRKKPLQEVRPEATKPMEQRGTELTENLLKAVQNGSPVEVDSGVVTWLREQIDEGTQISRQEFEWLKEVTEKVIKKRLRTRRKN